MFLEGRCSFSFHFLPPLPITLPGTVSTQKILVLNSPSNQNNLKCPSFSKPQISKFQKQIKDKAGSAGPVQPCFEDLQTTLREGMEYGGGGYLRNIIWCLELHLTRSEVHAHHAQKGVRAGVPSTPQAPRPGLGDVGCRQGACES